MYDTDLSDAQWSFVEPHLPPPKTGGRPRTTNQRSVVDAILYLLKTGCQWRLLPSDFPPWRSVYEYFARWRDTGVIKRIHRTLYFLARKAAGRPNKYPTSIIIGSQSVRTTKMGGVRGYDGGKRVKGRKRHLVVDTLGLPLAICVTAANVHDLTGGKKVLQRASKLLRGRSVKKLYADGSYVAKTFQTWVREKFSAIVLTAKNLAYRFKKFVPVSQRWVVERTFAWWGDYRRLIVDHERLLKTSKTMLRWASINIILSRLDDLALVL